MEQTPPTDAVGAWFKRYGQWFALAAVVVFFALPRLSPFEGLNQYLNVFERLSQWLLARLERLFRDYGYLVVFFGVLLENSMFLGLLVPGSIILILGGLSAQNGSINVPLVVALGIAGTIIGDTLSYSVGRHGWTRALAEGRFAGPMAKARASMERNHVWMILAYHWAGYSRVVGPAAAGLFRIPFRRWAPLDYFGGAVWVSAYVMLGYVLGLFGVQFGDTKSMVRLLEIVFTALIVIAIVVTIYQSSSEGRGDGTASEPVIVPVDEP